MEGVIVLSKMKRRFLRKKRKAERRELAAASYDTHHLCFQRRLWSNGAVKKLRSHWYCRIDIPKNTLHREIHAHMNNVPAPRTISAEEALYQLKKLEEYGAIHDSDPIEKRLSVLVALFDCIEQPTADAFKRQLQIVQEHQKAPR